MGKTTVTGGVRNHRKNKRGNCFSSHYVQSEYIISQEDNDDMKQNKCLYYSPHAAWVEVAARCGHSNQTGGEGQQQSVAAPVQSQGQELTSLSRVLTTPGDKQDSYWHIFWFLKDQRLDQRPRSKQMGLIELSPPTIKHSKTHSSANCGRTPPC